MNSLLSEIMAVHTRLVTLQTSGQWPSNDVSQLMMVHTLLTKLSIEYCVTLALTFFIPINTQCFVDYEILTQGPHLPCQF